MFSAIYPQRMKPGLAVLPMDVWADVFVYPWITRQKLAQIVDMFKERAFAEKLQTFLHDPKCGKHTLRLLQIYLKHSFEPKKCKYQLRKRKIVGILYNNFKNVKARCRTALAIASSAYRHVGSTPKDCEFPESEMPENVKGFKELAFPYYTNQF